MKPPEPQSFHTRHSYSVRPSVGAVIRCLKGLLPFNGPFDRYANVFHTSMLTIIVVLLMYNIWLGVFWTTIAYVGTAYINISAYSPSSYTCVICQEDHSCVFYSVNYT